MKINTLLVFFSVLICTGCASIESVKTVGKIGATLTDYKSVNYDAVFLCSSMQRINSTDQLPCDSLEKRMEKLNTGVDILVAYSSSLLLAIGEDDFKLSDVVEQTVKAGNAARWINVSDNQLAGAAGIAGGIQNLVVKGVKRKALRQTIRLVSGSLDTACSAMIGMVALQKQSFANYGAGVKQRFTIDSVFRAQLAGKNAGTLASLDIHADVLFLADKYVHDEIEKLDQAEKAITAFRKAHAIIAKESSRVGKKEDVKVLAQIIASIKDVYNGIEKLGTPVTEN